jgi:hypothetical protein
MTGSVGDAEDIVQDAFLYLKSARVRRETYVGDWLPEPVVVPAGDPGPAEHAELAEHWRATARRPRHGGRKARNSPAGSSRPPTGATWTR